MQRNEDEPGDVVFVMFREDVVSVREDAHAVNVEASLLVDLTHCALQDALAGFAVATGELPGACGGQLRWDVLGRCSRYIPAPWLPMRLPTRTLSSLTMKAGVPCFGAAVKLHMATMVSWRAGGLR